MPDSADAKLLKKRLAAAGFEIFRVVGPRIHLADRVRDNLILDSGVAAVLDPLRVRVVVRAPRSSYPSHSDAEIFDLARVRATEAISRGYAESDAEAIPVADPGGGGSTLETWYEVAYERAVADEEELVTELGFALGLEKAAGAG